VLFLVVYGIVEGLYMMSIVAFLFAWVYIMKENNSTPLTDVEVTENGIQVQSTFYPYAQIASFAILYDQGIARMLRCAMRKGITQIVDIPLTSDVNPAELKKYLQAFVEENTNAEFTKSDRMIQAMKL
jgi:hypothetical protein